MNTNHQQDLRPGEEEALQGLLREMAPEAEPAPEVRERIRLAVAAEWRAAVAPPARSARPLTSGFQRPALALAAGLAVAAVALGVFRTDKPAPAAVAATLTVLHGAVEAGAEAGWEPVTAGQSLTVGQKLITGPGGKAALTMTRGVTLRLDTDTRIQLAGIDRVYVERGAVYLDSGEESGQDSGEGSAQGPGVRLDTAFGSTRHLGTQYEVRVSPAEMLVSVREGLVETTGAAYPAANPGNTRAAGPVVARAGEQLVIGSSGVARRTVDQRDAHWSWIADVTPPYAIEERQLAEFLGWVCRETGRELTFASPEVQAAAQSIILRGSVAGLSPDEALAAVMATTNLSYSDDNGRLIIQPAVHQAATQ